MVRGWYFKDVVGWFQKVDHGASLGGRVFQLGVDFIDSLGGALEITFLNEDEDTAGEVLTLVKVLFCWEKDF